MEGIGLEPRPPKDVQNSLREEAPTIELVLFITTKMMEYL